MEGSKPRGRRLNLNQKSSLDEMRHDARRFQDMSSDMMKKMSPYELKITLEDVFPIRIYKSNFLREALDSLDLPKQTRKSFKKLFKVTAFKKAFLYLFWMVVAYKFRERTFGDLDHFNGRDEVTKAMKKSQKIQLYRLMEKDIDLGKKRRI